MIQNNVLLENLIILASLKVRVKHYNFLIKLSLES